MATAPMEITGEQASSRALLRFGLKHVFLATTAVAVVLAPAYWLGGFYLASVFFSGLLVAACSSVYATKYQAWSLPIAIFGAAFSFVAAIVVLVFFFHAILNLVLSFFLLVVRVRPRVYFAWQLGLAVGLYGLIIAMCAGRIIELAETKRQHPFVSVVDRLAFESKRPPTDSKATTLITLPAAVERQLQTVEQDWHAGYWDRAWALRQLHENTYATFAHAAGFGVMRMPSIRAIYFADDDRPRTTLPFPAQLASLIPSDKDLWDVHRGAVVGFGDANRIGYVRNRGAVAGFLPHTIGAPVARNSGIVAVKPPFWQVARLELVSLLRHDEPCVYVTQSLPQMDELAMAPTRPLDEFETSALPKIKLQEDVVFDQTAERIKMVGAVRAGTDCLQCHEGPRGKLLGAFSYELTRIPFATTPE